eukprot:43203-Pyramimonas_sp.AAC.1
MSTGVMLTGTMSTGVMLTGTMSTGVMLTGLMLTGMMLTGVLTLLTGAHARPLGRPGARRGGHRSEPAG